MKNISFLAVIIVFITMSCENEHDSGRVEFPISYSFYNQGDESLQKVVVYCTTFYPEEKETSWMCNGKWRDAYFYDSQYLLHNFDSLIVVPDLMVYSGCIYEYNVALHFLNNTGTGFVKLFAKTDTIHTNAAIEIKFVWPYDSLTYTRLN